MSFSNLAKPADDYDAQAWLAFYEANPGFHRSVGADANNSGDDGGDSGGDGGEGGDGGNDVQELIAEAVNNAVSGLKKTNAELKAEKTKLRERLDQLSGTLEKLGGDEGIESLLKMKEHLEKDELGKLLAEGKHDEWFDHRTAAMRKDHENQMQKLNEQLEQSSGMINTLRDQLRNTVLKAEVLSAAKDAGVLPEATADIILRAERAFSFDEERQTLVVKDEDGGVLFGKDGKTPKTVQEWLEEQRETARHWWPPSKGGGAGGSGDRSGEGGEDLASLPFAEYKRRRMEQRKQRAGY